MKRFSIFQWPSVVRRFRDEEEGTTAVEFAIVGGPFFLLIFAIIESSLFFFAGQYLETTVDDVTRLFRTGQFGDTVTETEFRDEFCDRLIVLFHCPDVRTTVEVALDFADLQNPEPPDEEGNLADSVFTTPGALEIIQVSAQVKWPVYTNFAAPLLHTESGNYALLQVVSVARTEPFN